MLFSTDQYKELQQIVQNCEPLEEMSDSEREHWQKLNSGIHHYVPRGYVMGEDDDSYTNLYWLAETVLGCYDVLDGERFIEILDEVHGSSVTDAIS